MIAYIREKNGECASLSIYSALQGFDFLGIPYKTYKRVEEIPLDPKCITVGFVDEVQSQLLRLGIKAPDIDYPPELNPWMGRIMEKTILNLVKRYIYEKPAMRYFIKPVRDKEFNAAFIEYPEDLSRFKNIPGDTPVWIGPYVSLGTEYRCYIYKNGEKNHCIGSYRYRGDISLRPDYCEISKMIDAYSSAPAAYALDIAVDANRVMRLVEVNDGYSIQNYGLSSADYAIWLMARWNQLVGEEAYKNLPSGLL